MEIIRAIILGIVQGATEFIPVSSSAHLVIVPAALNWPLPSLLFDTMLHWGTLAAVLTYFWRDWLAVIRGWFASLVVRGPWSTAPGGRLAAPENRLAWAIVIGSIPAAVLGFLFEDLVESLFQSPPAVGACLLVTALILAVSERLGRRVRDLATINAVDAILIGIAQGLALAPGISRSGATIGAGLGRAFKREEAARYSFMLSAPAILGAGLVQLTDAFVSPAEEPWSAIILGALAAGITGYLCIRFLLSYLRRRTLYAFAAYCAVLGLVVLIVSST